MLEAILRQQSAVIAFAKKLSILSDIFQVLGQDTYIATVAAPHLDINSLQPAAWQHCKYISHFRKLKSTHGDEVDALAG